jgi:hypothetical protein
VRISEPIAMISAFTRSSVNENSDGKIVTAGEKAGSSLCEE